MTTLVDVVNIGLQYIGTRTTVTQGELDSNGSNEAIQANLILTKLRDQLLRMAPWNCAMNAANLQYITSVPGTPENMSPATTLWQKGQPVPPWAYEYVYPVDCLRPCWIIPATQTGYAGAIPITTAITGGASAFWNGAPVAYKVVVDQFFPLTDIEVQTSGTGYAVGDQVTLQIGPNTSAPLGAPATLEITSVNGLGGITGLSIVFPGRYFTKDNPRFPDTTTGVGINATFRDMVYGPKADQRVIVTNQEFATLAYIKQVDEVNTLDPLFIDAWSAILGARLVMALVGDNNKANLAVRAANDAIEKARTADGNEGLTINDVTPDWIRVRGVSYTEGYGTPFSQFDWGPMFSYF